MSRLLYNKTNWKDDETTPINARNLNNLEDGIEYVYEKWDEIISDSTTGDHAAELIDARKNKKTLGERLDGIDTQFNTIAIEKISKGNVSASDINKNLGKFDSSYLTDDLISAIAGTANIYPTLQSRGVVSGEIGINTITPELTTFIKTSKNLFNKNVRHISKSLYTVDGLLIDSSTSDVSDYIAVSPNVTYTRNSANIACFYDKAFQFISAIGEGRQILTPANTSYVRLVVPKVVVDSYQFELGGLETTYQDYGNVFDVELLKDGSINANKTTFFEVGKNLFNKNSAITGYYVDCNSGILVANSSYTSSDYIEVLSNEIYSYNFNGQLAFYDKNKIYISGINGGGNVANKTLTTPSNCKYIRFSTKLPNEFQVELGEKCTSYESYGYFIKKEVIPTLDGYAKHDDFLLFLPSEICIAKGRTIELYNNQVSWCGNINNYHFKWDCQVGRAFKRKFSITGNTIGNYPLILYVYDNNMQLVISASTTIKVVDNVKSNTINILSIGDSLTNTTSTYKHTYAEIRTLSNNKLNFVGTRGLVEGEKHEGRSGWASSTFLSNASYTFENEGVNPFWDGTRFNWSHYKNTTGVNPNAIDIWLGTNGINLNPDTNANNIKQIVDYIRQDDVNIPIFITFTLYRANQDGIGSQTSNDGYDANKLAWKLEEDRKVFNLMVKLNELLKEYTNLYFVPVSLCHDSEFNFGNREVAVNPRATQTELMPVEATHPQEQGYLQIADIKFSSYFAHLS